MFQPHGYCLNWTPWILWLTVVGNALIALAYYSIPVTLIYLVRQKPDMVWNWVFTAFATFIFACGTVHVMDIVVIWYPLYGLSAAVTAFTAASSAFTACMLVYLVPAVTGAIHNADSLKALLLRANEELERLAEKNDAPRGAPEGE
jgi:hypothetical protein